MTLVGGQMSVTKTNVYRSLVDQPLLAANTNRGDRRGQLLPEHGQHRPGQEPAGHGQGRRFGTPVAAVGNNLATFLGNRLSMSFINLGCATFGLTNPVTVTLDGNGVATAVTYSLAQQTAKGATAATTATNPKRRPGNRHAGPRRPRHRWPDPVGHVTEPAGNGIKRTQPACGSGESGAAGVSYGGRTPAARGEVGQRELGIRRRCLPDAHRQGEGGAG